MRTDRWKFIQYYKEPFVNELYDLRTDPFEMDNLINDPDHADIVKGMTQELASLMEFYDDPGIDYRFFFDE
ncbi:MAG: DUF4976 domain-containing protein [Opitutales bacterium]|nr:DUF4976 domain-containing protein [Opitutales bacterium]